jgi:hypothetical protein
LQAVRTSWSAKKVEETQKRLQTIRDELQYRILISLKEDSIRSLDEVDRTTLAAVIESNRVLRTQTEHIAKQQKTDGNLARQRHSEVLAAVSQRQTVSSSTKDLTAKIRGRLYFPRQDDRFDDIAIAHQRTFDWALQDQAPHQTWASLTKWLREDSGVYWISGKAGSGKSTLMKYLTQDPRMMQELKTWAGGDSLILATFYFWNSGAEIQRSQQGLFRSLLWQILDQDPSFGPQLFPDLYLPEANWNEFPTFHQLRRAFGRLVTRPGMTKIVLIVDGLDEFDAVKSTMTELSELFLSASASLYLKALVSSRPLSAFEASFENEPKLRLQELTYNDITKFVDDRLGTHPRIIELAAQSPAETRALVGEIVDAASGVFLWVKLVVDCLLEGLRNQDTILALQNRLKRLPKGLEALFEHLLKGIPSEYELESSQYFQLIRCYHETPYNVPLSALALSYFDTTEDFVLQAPVEPLSSSERAKIEEVMRHRLRSRCVGLLELQPRSNAHFEIPREHEVVTQVTQDVTYLHRTVADYLAREEVWCGIISHTRSTNFHVPQALLKSTLMEIKLSVFALAPHNMCSYEIELWQLVLNAMHFASLIEETTSMASLALLDDLDGALSSHFIENPATLAWNDFDKKPETWCDTWFDDFPRPTGSHDNFLSFTTEQGLQSYVCEKLQQNPKCMRKHGRPLLDYACNSGPRFDLPRPKIVQALLRNGANLNLAFRGYSPWINLLVTIPRDLEVARQQIFVINEMLLHGANPNSIMTQKVRISKRDYRVFRQSMLRYINCFRGRIIDSSTIFTGNRDTTIRLKEEKVRDRQQALNDLVKLLESKGAKEKEWHKVGEAFIQVGGLRSKSYGLWRKLRDYNGAESDSNRKRWGRAFLLNYHDSYCKSSYSRT